MAALEILDALVGAIENRVCLHDRTNLDDLSVVDQAILLGESKAYCFILKEVEDLRKQNNPFSGINN